jgi:hypothetical protein
LFNDRTISKRNLGDCFKSKFISDIQPFTRCDGAISQIKRILFREMKSRHELCFVEISEALS